MAELNESKVTGLERKQSCTRKMFVSRLREFFTELRDAGIEIDNEMMFIERSESDPDWAVSFVAMVKQGSIRLTRSALDKPTNEWLYRTLCEFSFSAGMMHMIVARVPVVTINKRQRRVKLMLATQTPAEKPECR